MEVRERKHMQRLSVYNTGLVQYDKSLQNIHQGLGAAYDRAQVRLNRVREKAFRQNNEALIKMMSNSKFGDLSASGRTGRSISRMGVLEKGALGRFYAQRTSDITDAREDFMLGVKRMHQKAKLAQEQEFTKVAFAPVPDVAPPPPVMQNVGMAMFGDFLGFAGTVASIASSERALKENIKKIGTAKSGLGIYKFNYIGYPDKQYVGAMADEVEKIFPDAVEEQPGNYLGVNYDKIDVMFKEVA